MRTLIETAKNFVAEALYFTGLLRLALLLRYRRHAAILMYHRVLPESSETDSFSTEGILVTPDEFDWQMRLLRRYLRPADLDTLEALLDPTNPASPARACVVTFDDGWFDNHDYALPILERHRVPATIFVCTGYIGTAKCFWQETLTRILCRAWQDTSLGGSVLPLLGAEHLAEASASDVRRLAREVVSGLKAQPPEQIATLLDQARSICAASGFDTHDVGDDRFMSWSDVSRLARSEVVAVESHAVTHTPLDRLPAQAQLEELSAARRQIESVTGRPVRAVAYPNGDFDSVVVESTRRAGYRLAMTTLEGRVAKGDDPLRLKRINIHKAAARTPARFLCRVAGIL